MNAVANTRWVGSPSPPPRTYETPVEVESRELLLLLSELAAAERNVTRIKAEIAAHARVLADASGEWLLPTIGQLRARLGVNQ